MNEHNRRRTDKAPRDDRDMILAAAFGLLWFIALIYVAWRAASVQ